MRVDGLKLSGFFFGDFSLSLHEYQFAVTPEDSVFMADYSEY